MPRVPFCAHGEVFTPTDQEMAENDPEARNERVLGFMEACSMRVIVLGSCCEYYHVGVIGENIGRHLGSCSTVGLRHQGYCSVHELPAAQEIDLTLSRCSVQEADGEEGEESRTAKVQGPGLWASCGQDNVMTAAAPLHQSSAFLHGAKVVKH